MCCLLVVVNWFLALNGLIQWDFRAMFMKFQHLGATVTLVGLYPTDHSLQEGDQFFRKPQKRHSVANCVFGVCYFICTAMRPCY